MFVLEKFGQQKKAFYCQKNQKPFKIIVGKKYYKKFVGKKVSSGG
jgi:hypothetical protein